jgi:pyruvate,water dikinase
MEMFSKIFSGLFSRKPPAKREDIEKLRSDFQERYHYFKLLINSNNKALKTMSEIEEALKGASPFGMIFILSRCTSVATSVWKIIDNLNKLSSGRYDVLVEKFKEIQLNINPFLKLKEEHKEGPYTIPLSSVGNDHADQVGNKMASLGEAGSRMGLNISQGFAITAKAYERFMEYNGLTDEINRRIKKADKEDQGQLNILSSSIRNLVIESTLPPDLESAIAEQYKLMEEKFGRVSVALRSSALGEDLLETSFAGQYKSELNVNPDNIYDAYKGILASKYSLPAMTYRLNRGIRDEDIAMCVGCTRMIDADAGGVMYSKNPINLRDDSIVINSVWGLPKSVVDGSSASDLFVVSRKDDSAIINREISRKDMEYICYPEEGVCRMDLVGDKADQASLTDEQVLQLADIAVKIEEYYKSSQDIEWAIENNNIVILQCRPLQRIAYPDRSLLKTGTHEISGLPLLKGGLTASPGVAAGNVFVVRKDMDVLRFPEKAILVVSQGLPRWASLLGRAAGVITEQGSITSHLANVAREFGVPAIFGMKNATEQLNDGQMVTVDADDTRIYDGSIEELLKNQSSPINLMKGSPVYESLKGAARHIIPLNLLEPDSHSFKPENCKTFHDITRFCHEKSVDEMFNFGKDHHFPERSSKQLYINIPLKWWILNLDDGFHEEIKGKYVKIENIASVPMLALWEGISAKPWEGPPPIDGKGFMSVMFRATANPALVTGARSNYGERNYFLISKNYCSLSSRLGFHFSTVEALASERKSENYVKFQFKGGAADEERKVKRVEFIGDMLEDYGFKVELNGDNLTARVEGHEMEYMVERLKILGYLTIHTRQLDMIMARKSAARYYYSKLKKEIDELIFRQRTP